MTTTPATIAPPAVQAYFDAINHDDWDRLEEALREDVVVRPPGMAPVHGLAAAKVHYAKLLSGFPEHVDEPTRVLLAGDSVVVEIDFRGRTDQGKDVEFQAVDVFDLVDGKIARVRIWYDTREVLKQIRG